MLFVGLRLKGPFGSSRNSLFVLVLLATVFGIVGCVGPTVRLAMLAELCNASLFRNSLI